MKKNIGVLLSFVLLFSVCLFTDKAEASAVNKHYTVNVNKLDVREKPSPKAKIVGSLKKGTSVFVYNTEPGGWSKIKYNNKAGYIATSGLKGQGGSSKPAPSKKPTPVLMKDIKFGMTYQQVKGKETRKLAYNYYDPSDESFLEYYVDKYGYKPHLVYYFDYNLLNDLHYDFNPDGKYYSNSQLRSIYRDLQSKAAKEFGGTYYYNERIYDDYVKHASMWKLGEYDVMLYVTNQFGTNNISLSYHEAGYSGASQDSKENHMNDLIEKVNKYNKQ